MLVFNSQLKEFKYISSKNLQNDCEPERELGFFKEPETVRMSKTEWKCKLVLWYCDDLSTNAFPI